VQALTASAAHALPVAPDVPVCNPRRGVGLALSMGPFADNTVRFASGFT
jgi:hypothetical protein